MVSASSAQSALLLTALTSYSKSRISPPTIGPRSARTSTPICTALMESAVNSTMLKSQIRKNQKGKNLNYTQKVYWRSGKLHQIMFITNQIPYRIFYCKIGKMYWMTCIKMCRASRMMLNRSCKRCRRTLVIIKDSRFSCKYLSIERKPRRSLIICIK